MANTEKRPPTPTQRRRKSPPQLRKGISKTKNTATLIQEINIEAKKQADDVKSSFIKLFDALLKLDPKESFYRFGPSLFVYDLEEQVKDHGEIFLKISNISYKDAFEVSISNSQYPSASGADEIVFVREIFTNEPSFLELMNTIKDVKNEEKVLLDVIYKELTDQIT